MNVPVGSPLAAGTALLRRDPRRAPARASTCRGQCSSPAGSSRSSTGITQANNYGWGSLPTTWAIFTAAIVLIGAFLAWEARQAEPLVPVLDLQGCGRSSAPT